MQKTVWILITVGILTVIVVSTVLIVKKTSNKPNKPDCPYCPGSTSKLGELCTKSEVHSYTKYAVSTDSNVCANAGKEILDEDGNAVDAAIAVLLCMGVTIPESMGLGGGSMIIIYNKTSDYARFVNAREMAPAAAYRDMYNSTKSDAQYSSSALGLQAIGVPGELAGYWHMYRNYGSGNIPWERLFKDAINFAENGFPVGNHLEEAMSQRRNFIMEHEHLKNVYVNSETEELYKHGEIFKQPQLAETLRNLSLAQDPHQYFYEEIAAKILYDLYEQNDFPNQKPILTAKDFTSYEIIEEDAYSFDIKDGIKLHTNKLPGSGAVLSFILRIMLHPKFHHLYPNAKNDYNEAVLFYHRLMEAYKFAYSRRMYLGDDRFDNCTNVLSQLTSKDYIDKIVEKINDATTYPSKSGFYDVDSFQELDHGTAHVSVLDKHGNAVAASTTVNLYFGSKVISPSTGLILNDQMDDFNTGKTNAFDLPPAFANTVAAGKRPLSSMSPSVFVDETGPRLIIGASGGSKITTAVALVSLRNLWMNDDIKLAIDSARVHHQLFPTNVENEACFPTNILDSLKEKNHQIKQIEDGDRGAIVMAISRLKNGTIRANSDWRKGGTIAGV